jgi:chaperonin GroEL
MTANEGKPALITKSGARMELKQGFDQMAHLLGLTLGPLRGSVLSSLETREQPELLSDAATIARRIIALPDRAKGMGAMLMRQLVWRVHERVGDGGAIAAVLAQAIMEHAIRYVTSGANAMLMAKGVKDASKVALEQLANIAKPAEDVDTLTAVAEAVTGNAELSFVLGEMYDLIGMHAHITIEDYVAPYLERAYIEGGMWEASIASGFLINSPSKQQAVLSDCFVAAYNGVLESGGDVVPLLEIVSDKEPARLLIMATKISDEALKTLVSTNAQGKIKVSAVNLKRVGIKAQNDLEDLAILTGAKVLGAEAGRPLKSIKEEDLGKAHRVQASAERTFVVGKQAKSGAIREQIEILQKRLKALPFSDEERLELQARLARLSGSSAILKIGAYTKAERADLHQRAEHGVKALAATMEEGYVPGGGTAYLHCIKAIEEMGKAKSIDEEMGRKAVQAGLEAVFCRLLENAGVSESPHLFIHEIRSQAPGLVYDVVSNKLTSAEEAGILDAAKVLRVALESASSGAMMAITTEVLVMKRKPRMTYEP